MDIEEHLQNHIFPTSKQCQATITRRNITKETKHSKDVFKLWGHPDGYAILISLIITKGKEKGKELPVEA